jgi:hypothetical protein
MSQCRQKTYTTNPPEAIHLKHQWLHHRGASLAVLLLLLLQVAAAATTSTAPESAPLCLRGDGWRADAEARECRKHFPQLPLSCSGDTQYKYDWAASAVTL